MRIEPLQLSGTVLQDGFHSNEIFFCNESVRNVCTSLGNPYAAVLRLLGSEQVESIALNLPKTLLRIPGEQDRLWPSKDLLQGRLV